MTYITARTSLLLSFFDWAHPYCNQLKKDYPLVMPTLNKNKEFEMKVVENNIAKLSYEILTSEKGISLSKGCNGEGFIRHWWSMPDGVGRDEIYMIFLTIKMRCESICKLFNGMNTDWIWFCINISILTTNEQIKERLNRKWSPKNKFLRAIMRKIEYSGGGEYVRSQKSIKKDIDKGSRSYDNEIIEAIEKTNLIDEIKRTKFDNNPDYFRRFLYEIQGRITPEVNTLVDELTKDINGFQYGLKESSGYNETYFGKMKGYVERYRMILTRTNINGFNHLMLLSIDPLLISLIDSLGYISDVEEKSRLEEEKGEVSLSSIKELSKEPLVVGMDSSSVFSSPDEPVLEMELPVVPGVIDKKVKEKEIPDPGFFEPAGRAAYGRSSPTDMGMKDMELDLGGGRRVRTKKRKKKRRSKRRFS